MKIKILLFFVALIVVNKSCTSPNQLDKWAVGASNRNINELQSMAENKLTCMEVGWPNTANGTQSQDETITWAKEMKAAADKAGVEIWSIHIPFGGIYDISKTDEIERQKAVTANAADMETAYRILGPKYFIIHASAEPVREEERVARFTSSRKSLQELAAKAKTYGVGLLVENLPRTCLGNTSTELLNIISGIDNTAVCFDVNHLLQESHVSFIRNAKGRIKSVHMSDYDKEDERHWLPGKGLIDWSELLQELLKNGYTGPFMFEVTRGNPPTISMQDLAQCWNQLKEEAKNYVRPRPELIVCGDDQILIIDEQASNGSDVKVVWHWQASNDALQIPEAYQKYLVSMDDCKPVDGGRNILVTSSSGAVLLIERSTKKCLFYAHVPNAHTADVLPDGRIAVALSVNPDGNKINIYDRNQPEKVLFSDSLYSGHGVVWNRERKRLYTLGYDDLREYSLVNWNTLSPALKLERKWTIPGISGHDLSFVSADELLVTEHYGVHLFDLRTESFTPFEPLKNAENIKSVTYNKENGQIIFTQAEESWWTFNIYLRNPDKTIHIPDIKLYKVRIVRSG